MATRLEALATDFRGVFEEVCRVGYSALGRTNLSAADDPAVRFWHATPAFPPSYAALGRYRFLDSLNVARALGGTRVLEVAAGDGFNAACVYEPGVEVFINDLRPRDDRLALWATGSALNAVGGNFFDLDPTQLGEFDLIIALEVIEHVAHGDQMLRHLRKFMAKGGRLILSTPNGAYFRSTLQTASEITDFAALEQRQFEPDADGHLYLYTSTELRKLLVRCGFEVVTTRVSITPFISGHAGLRFLPKGRRMTRLYFFLDQLATSVSARLTERVGTHLVVVAEAQ